MLMSMQSLDRIIAQEHLMISLIGNLFLFWHWWCLGAHRKFQDLLFIRKRFLCKLLRTNSKRFIYIFIFLKPYRLAAPDQSWPVLQSASEEVCLTVHIICSNLRFQTGFGYCLNSSRVLDYSKLLTVLGYGTLYYSSFFATKSWFFVLFNVQYLWMIGIRTGCQTNLTWWQFCYFFTEQVFHLN